MCIIIASASSHMYRFMQWFCLLKCIALENRAWKCIEDSVHFRYMYNLVHHIYMNTGRLCIKE